MLAFRNTQHLCMLNGGHIPNLPRPCKRYTDILALCGPPYARVSPIVRVEAQTLPRGITDQTPLTQPAYIVGLPDFYLGDCDRRGGRPENPKDVVGVGAEDGVGPGEGILSEANAPAATAGAEAGTGSAGSVSVQIRLRKGFVRNSDRIKRKGWDDRWRFRSTCWRCGDGVAAPPRCGYASPRHHHGLLTLPFCELALAAPKATLILHRPSQHNKIVDDDSKKARVVVDFN
ncbi:hypothetical protein B0T14DRAFT_85470 [Immersiella caudata]|uniref:Uncharacterized protein n=1 Tax=Immersiella caudata TaxID=314043 RepID=A0AA39XHD2_9PEZI|nr:hypothetical protein B0T14DRAFT_85470 [Immersiella caudata]